MTTEKQSFFSYKIIRHMVVSGFLEFGPVLIFLSASSSEKFSVHESTILLMVATIISTFATYVLQKRIPFLALYIALITTVFGMLTIHSHEVKFIQMRDTLYDITCAFTLVVGMVARKPFLKIAFEKIFSLTGRAWSRLTHLWIGYFLVTAFSNEIVRSFFSFQDWIVFKAVMVIFTSVFGVIALYVSFELKDEVDNKTTPSHIC